MEATIAGRPLLAESRRRRDVRYRPKADIELQTALTGAKPASKALLLERPVQRMVSAQVTPTRDFTTRIPEGESSQPNAAQLSTTVAQYVH